MMKWIFISSPAQSPQQRATPSSQSGFSIVELMISVVLLAISATMAFPSYRDLVEKRQTVNGAERVASFIGNLQREVLEQNRIVTISYAVTQGEWCMGAVVGFEPCNCASTVSSAEDYCTIDAAPRMVRFGGNSDLKILGIANGTGNNSLNAFSLGGDQKDDALKVDLRSDSEQYQLILSLTEAGQVTLCSNSPSHHVPGYNSCNTGMEEQES